MEELRDNPRFLYKVARAFVFGSYLSDADRINDVDIAVELVAKEKDPEKLRLLDWEKAQEVMYQGRLLNLTEQQFWAEIEVQKHLKSRSRISLHPIEDIAIDPRAKLIYEEKT